MTILSNPYVGPRSFETGEALYGRDRELRTLSALLIAERIVLLHSPSGAGKTSLLKAGLLPQLRKEDFNVLPQVRVNIELPAEARAANRYLLSTLISLEEGFPAEKRLPLADLAALNLDEYLNQRATGGQDTLLIFDQFEEVLTVSAADRDGKLEFFNQVGVALRNKKRWALFSMREDYLGALAPYVRPIPNRLATRFRLDLLSAEAAVQAMQKPAQTLGVDFLATAAQKLADDLRRVQVQLPDGSLETQLGQYVEPVQLQVVCYRLWESKAADNMRIDEYDLASVGDVNQSLAEYYALSVEKVTQASGVAERSIREWFDHKLITPEGIRGQVRLGAETSDGLPNAAVRKLEDAHIIRAEQRAGQTWYELAHDRLIVPVREDNRKWFAANLSLFQQQAKLWSLQGRGEGLLLRGKELEQAEEESKKIALTPDETAFLEAGRKLRAREQRDRRQRQFIVAGLVASLVMLAAAVYFGFSANAATKSARDANAGLIVAVHNAEAALTQASLAQSEAQAASTQAIAQQSTAEADRARAQSSEATAVAALKEAKEQRTIAQEQEQLAGANERLAQANSLVAQSLAAEKKAQEDLANLLAVEAFRIADNSSTRPRLLTSLSNKGQMFLVSAQNSGTTSYIGFGLDGKTLVSNNFYNCAADSKYYLCGQGVIKFWKIKITPRANGALTGEINQDGDNGEDVGYLDNIIFSPDRKSVVSAFCDPNDLLINLCEKENIILWDAQTRSKRQAITFTAKVANSQNVLLAYNGQILAVAYYTSSLANNAEIALLDMQTNTEKGPIQVETNITQMAFAPDGKTLLFADGTDRNINSLNPDSLQISTIPVEGLAKPIQSLAFSPDGKIIALGSTDGTIVLWDTQTSKPIGQMLGRPTKVLSLAFSPDGSTLAAGHDDFYLALWDVESRAQIVRPIFKHTSVVYNIAFSVDGKLLASAGDEIILWDFDPASWVNKACVIAGRNFTQAEWAQYFQNEPYRATCSQWPDGK